MAIVGSDFHGNYQKVEKFLNYKPEEEHMIKQTDLIVDELFRRVGFDEYSGDFVIEHPKDWFLHKTWTSLEQESFKTWLIDHLRTKCGFTKKGADKQAGYIILNYGWRVQD